MPKAKTDDHTIHAWLHAHVTQDPRALAWFLHTGAEDRIARAYRQLLAGYNEDPSQVLKTTRKVDGVHYGHVTVRDIHYYSTCAHHFLPFFGQVAISYLPGDRIIGLGKLPRLVQIYAQRFQIQEDLVKDIAEAMMEHGGARGVLVTASGRHMCMCSRGPANQTAITDTSYSLGALQGLTRHEDVRV
jgi:GTP cyclohydrolase I